jgi:hypothetical protein
MQLQQTSSGAMPSKRRALQLHQGKSPPLQLLRPKYK